MEACADAQHAAGNVLDLSGLPFRRGRLKRSVPDRHHRTTVILWAVWLKFLLGLDPCGAAAAGSRTVGPRRPGAFAADPQTTRAQRGPGLAPSPRARRWGPQAEPGPVSLRRETVAGPSRKSLESEP